MTGTPQAIFLQTMASGWHPLFTYYFNPENGYLGGDFFFPKSGRPDCVTYLDVLDQAERDIVIRHILVSAQIFASGGDIAKGTGALLSPNDWQLGGSFPRKVVLTMYQVTGTKGWGGRLLWVPNIKLPQGSVYYDVIED